MELGIEINEEGKNYAINYENAVGWRRSLSRLIEDEVVFSLKDARELLKKQGDVVIYEVYNLWKTIPRIKEFSEKTGVNCDVTVLNHGVISTSGSGELFFTYGHRHEKGFSELGRLRLYKEARARKGKRMILALAGCVAQAEGEEILARAPYVDLIVGPQSYHYLPRLVLRVQEGETGIVATDFPPESKFAHLPIKETEANRHVCANGS